MKTGKPLAKTFVTQLRDKFNLAYVMNSASPNFDTVNY